MSKPDFEALRAERNKAHEQFCKELEAEGWKVHQADPDRCYCACASGGPCEHDWSGPEYESEDGSLVSATCARCGMTAFSHDLRNAP